MVCEGELRAGVRAFATTDQPGAVGPVVKVDLAGQLRHPRPFTRFAVGIDRRPPRIRAREDRVTHRLLIAYPSENRMSVSRHANANS